MSLERRAEQAVRSLRSSISEVSPVRVPAIARRQRLAWAGAVAVVTMLAGLTFAVTQIIPSEDDPRLADPTIPTSIPATTTIPQESDPIVIPGGEESSTTVPSDGTAVTVTTTPGSTTTDPGSTTSTTRPTLPPVILATAQQTIGSSADSEPSGAYSGTAPSGTRVEVTSAYGSAATTAGSNGEWSVTVSFTGVPIGEAFPVSVLVGGRSFLFTYSWTYTPPITASQELGTSDAELPVETFTGTAPPGTAVSAASAYGSGSTTADANGNWSLQVAFTDAPVGTAFPITVGVGSEDFTFSFTWTYAPAATAVQLIGSSSSANPYDQFSGTAPGGTAIRIESIYGSAAGLADTDGEWFLEVRFDNAPPWEHFEEFPVTVYVGETRFDFTFTWTYQPSVTAEQHFGSSIAPAPFERFSGQASPGTTVTASSDYGTVSTVAAGDDGDWQMDLYFSGQPANEPFTITVTVGTKVFTFSFIWEPVSGDSGSSGTTTTTTTTTPEPGA